MAATNLSEHILGSFGQIIRGGPFYESDGVTPRDMTSFTVTCELYAPRTNTSTGGGSGFGTTDGFIEYRIASTDLQILGIWGTRLFAEDADERLPSKRGFIKVVEPSQGE